MKNGCWGRILRIDLSNKTTKIQKLQENVFREYIGGSGLGAKIIVEENLLNLNPLSKENKLIFASGPYNATKVPGTGRWEVSSISPYTNMWGESNGGGFFGHYIKKSGFDAIVLEGISETPVYIKVEDTKVEIKDASHLWGKSTYETSKVIKNEEGNNYSEVVIGPAGENLVPMANIMSDYVSGHAGRTGMGTVMGSKKVKALILKGKELPDLYDEEKVNNFIKNIRKEIMKSEHRKNMYANGQTGSIVPREENGLLPIKNWTLGEWRDGAAKIGQPTYNEVLNAKPKSCAFCPMGCKRWVKIDDGEWYDHEGHGPEYETLAMLGSSLLIDDLKKISYANYLCDSFGIDTMSVAGIIGMIFELYEKGIIDNNYLDGIKAEWGNADAMIELVKKIGISEGIGKILNKGVKYLSKLWDNSYEELDLEVRGLEIPAHDPRAFHSMAVTYATSPRGACHMHGYSGAISLGRLIPEMGIDEQVSRFSSNKKGRAAVVFQDIASMHNSLTWCMTLQGANFLYDKQIELLNAITGWEFDIKEFCKTGERITNLQQLINLKRGLTREDIKLPRRFRTGLNEGGTKGTTPEFEVMMEEYLQVREWDNNAIPTEKKLRELNLEDYAK